MRRRSERTPLLIALIVLASMAAPAGATIVPIVDQDSWDGLGHTIEGVAFLDLTLSEIYFPSSEERMEAEADPDERFTPANPNAATDASTASSAPEGSTSREIPGAATALLGACGSALLLMARCLRHGRNWTAGRMEASSRLPAAGTAKAPAVRRCWYRENGLVYATCVSIRGRRRG